MVLMSVGASGVALENTLTHFLLSMELQQDTMCIWLIQQDHDPKNICKETNQLNWTGQSGHMRDRGSPSLSWADNAYLSLCV